MIIVAKNESIYAVNCPNDTDRYDDDDSAPYREDMGADNTHYHWDYMEMLCFSGNEYE